MDSRNEYSQGDNNAHNGVYKETGVCSAEYENLQNNLTCNKPGYGEKAFSYLEGDALSIISNSSWTLQSEHHLNSNCLGTQNANSEKVGTESILYSTNNSSQGDTRHNEDSNMASEIKTLNISPPSINKPASNFPNTRMRNSYRMAVQVLPKYMPDSRKHIQKSRSENKNDNNRSITKDTVPKFRPSSPALPKISRSENENDNRSITKDTLPKFRRSSSALPKIPPKPVLTSRHINRNAQNHCTKSVLHCDVISGTDDFKHHVYEEIDEIRENIILLNKPELTLKTSVNSANQLSSEHIRTSMTNISEEGVEDNQLDLYEENKFTAKNDVMKCSITPRDSKVTNIIPNVAFQAEIAREVQKMFREQREQIQTSFDLNSGTDILLTKDEQTTSRDSVRSLEKAMPRKRINTFEPTILSVHEDRSSNSTPDITLEGINTSNDIKSSGRSYQEMNITRENINAFERSEAEYNEKKKFFEKFQGANISSYQEHDSCQQNMMRSTSENQMVKSNEVILEDIEDRRNLDEVWMNYISRPPLPLKSLIKQKSLSCSNLVQTFKLFSKRNLSDNSKGLLVETTEKSTEKKRENYISEASISKDDKAKDSPTGIHRQHENNFVGPPEIQNYVWFHQVDAKEAARKLLSLEQDGAFLIRPASNPSKTTRYTLCVLCARTVYNMHIRDLENGLFALGEKKEREKKFSSLLELIQYHQDTPLKIATVQTGQIAYIYLLITPSK